MEIQVNLNATRMRVTRMLKARKQELRRPHCNGECAVIEDGRVIGEFPGIEALAMHLGVLKPYERLTT